MKDTDREENADPREDYIRRWECLKIVRAGIIHEETC